MPIKPLASEDEKTFIGRCMSEEKDAFPDQSQRYAVCKSSWDKTNMSRDFAEEKQLFVIKPRKNETRGMYLTRCSRNSKMREQYPNMKERSIFCLTSFNNYYKWWAKLEEFGDIPKDSALGECIAKEKAAGKDYRTAYAACSTKVVSPNTTIVLSEDDDLLIEPVMF